MSPEPVETVEETGSLADHEAQFGEAPARVIETPVTEPADPDPLEPETVEPAQTRTTTVERHRAASQSASPTDVETIAQLTKELRETEEALGLQLERKSGESQRVFNLRRRVAIAKAVREARQPQKPSPVATPPPVASATPTDWTEAEPTIEQFHDKPDPYGAWQRALAAYDRRKDAFDAKQAEAKQSAETSQKAVAEHRKQIEADFNQRVKDYIASPAGKDYAADIKAVGERPTPLLLGASLVGDPEGPRYIHVLAKNSELFDEFFLMTDGKPVTPENVAVTQRRLKARILAVTTGSAASAPPLTAPRPPNPVRTGPIRVSETPPSDDASIADHEAFYHKPRQFSHRN